MILRLLIVSSLVFFFSCQKSDGIVIPDKTVTDLLTQQQWLIEVAGFDDNLNGIVDGAENTLTDCQQDNIYIFSEGGNGAIQEGGIDCNPTSALLFTWTLQNGDKEILINDHRYFIVRVTEDELLLRAEVPAGTADFLLRYSH